MRDGNGWGIGPFSNSQPHRGTFRNGMSVHKGTVRRSKLHTPVAAHASGQPGTIHEKTYAAFQRERSLQL